MDAVKIFPSPFIMAEKLASELARRIIDSAHENKHFTIALSGGSTPELLYSILSENFSKSIPWEYAHLFWGDERCVPPDNDDSNYGTAERILIQKTGIPSKNVHRIRGEDDPFIESVRYAGEIELYLKKKNNLPEFNFIILGIGEDGHTASIFPGDQHLFSSAKICEVTTHPSTGQKRITLTGRVINNARAVAFLVSGKKKAMIVRNIINKCPGHEKYPASEIDPFPGKVEWYLDQDAASLL
jgi:6-phosphogluconolactonase